MKIYTKLRAKILKNTAQICCCSLPKRDGSLLDRDKNPDGDQNLHRDPGKLKGTLTVEN